MVVASPFHIRFNFSKEKRGENKKNCVNNLQEKKEAIGEIDRHRVTDIICILTISKIKLVEVVLPNVHFNTLDQTFTKLSCRLMNFHSSTTGWIAKTTNDETWVPANSYNTVT